MNDGRELRIFLVACVALGSAGIGAVAWWRATHPAPPAPAVRDVPITHAGYHDSTHDPALPCECETARRRNAWCRHHGIGWVAGIRIESSVLHDAVDAHGHDIDPSALRCEGCRAAFASDGRCAKSRIGFVGGLLYSSELTYWLAVASPTDGAGLDCATCREHTRAAGWCGACGIGHLGPFAFATRADYDLAAVEYERLREAVLLVPECELCAGAQFMGGICPRCRISYRESG